MRLRQIEVFHAIYTYGSITAAAKFLNVSQPSVSKVLAHAEQQLGYALFDRVRGKVIPTLEAERLIGHVSSVYQGIDELQRVSRHIGASDMGCIRLAVTPAFGIDLVPYVIATYLARHPETEFEVETLHYHQIVRAIMQSRIDIGIAFQPAPAPELLIEKLSEAQFVVLASPGTVPETHKSCRLDDLENFPFIRLSDRGPLGQMLNSKLEKSGLSSDTRVRAETYQVAKALAAHGAGVTIVDEITARSSGHAGVRILPLKPRMKFAVGLMRLESAPLSIVAHRFIRHLRAEVKVFLDEPLPGNP